MVAAAESGRSGWGLLLGPLLGLVVGLLPLPGLAPEAQRTAAVATWMAVWWLTEAVPIPVTSLLPLVAFPVVGVLSSPAAAAPYANHLIFLFMAGFFIAQAMQRWGLHRRIALRIVAGVGTGPRRLVLGVMLATALLSMWIPNTAVAVMMLPIGVALIGELRGQPGTDPALADSLGTALMLGIAYASSIGGVATLIGTPPNLVFAAMAEELVGGQVDFLAWLGVGVPVTALLFPLCWLYLTRWACPLPAKRLLRRDVIRDQLRSLGPMDQGERAALMIFVATALGLVLRTEKQIGGLVIPGIETFLPQVADATVAMGGALAAFCIPLSLRRRTFVLDWESARDIRWGILILFGGGLSLAEAFQSTGLTEWIAGAVTGFEALPPWAVVTLATTLIIFLTELTSNTATATMAMPIFASAAVGLGIHPYLLMAPAAIASSMAFMMPVATPPNAIVFGSGLVTIRQMARAGLAMNLVSIVVATLAGLFLVPWVLGA